MKQALVAVMLGMLLSGAGATTTSPNDVVKEAADLLGVALDGRKEELAKDRDALYALIDEILLPRFDRKYAAQLVLGPAWRTATPEQRKRFIAAFYRNLLQKYADGVLEYDESKIEILPYRDDPTKPRTTVRTTVLLNDGTKVPVNYSLVKRDSGWMLFDVTIEGISYVRNFRAELGAEIQRTGLDAVIARLEAENKNAGTTGQ